MTRIANVGDGAVASLASGVTMCQCERLTRATLDAAIADGCATVNDLKGATRCGMGPFDLDALAGDFDYDALPMPATAPL